MKRLISTLALAAASATAFGQAVKVGDVAPNFTLTDINGKSHNLYSYLDSGYAVILDISAAWCGPCWNAKQAGVFKDITNHYGPGGSMTAGKVKFIFIEGEPANTTAQLYGPAVSTGGAAVVTQGDWVTGSNYPIIDNSTLNSKYLHGGFPSFTVIGRDRLVSYTTSGFGSSMNEAFWLNIVNTQTPQYAPSATTDAKAVPYSGVGYTACKPTATVSFQNYSKTTLTSATIKIYNGTTQVGTQAWSGSVAPYGIANVPINASSITGTVGFAPYKFEVVASGDTQPSNNMSKDSLFKVYTPSTAKALPYAENFDAYATARKLPYDYTTASSAGLFYANTAGSPVYTVTNSNGSKSVPIGMGYFDMAANEKAEVMLGGFNTAGATNVTLAFDVAYAPYAANEADKLEVMVSKDCGANWTSVYNKSGATLQTTTPANTVFTNPTASQWRREQIALGSYADANMLVKFVGTRTPGNADNGSLAWIDNVRMTKTLDVANTIATSSVSLFPNPAKDAATLEFSLVKGGKVVVNVLDAVGRTVSVAADATMAAGTQRVQIPTTGLAAGVYNINILTEDGTLTQRLTVVK